MSSLRELREAKLEKLRGLIELGVDPYPPFNFRFQKIGEVCTDFDSLVGRKVSVAGRIRSLRAHGKVSFIDIEDYSGRIQLIVKSDNLISADYKNNLLGYIDLGLIDVGDFVSVLGNVIKSVSGEKSVEVTELRFLSKSLRPIPSDWEGLKDVEERYRLRYLDFLVNRGSREVLDKRWTIVQETRTFLWKEGFLEVETPILQPLYGGTNAKPFVTHFNSLDSDFYLRVAPELYLKRLIVGGYEKIFEIARNFRNEGIDHTHFPEFTMLEWYEAYSDYNRVMDLAEALLKHLVQKIHGSLKLTVKGVEVDVSGNWPRITVDQALMDYLGIDWISASDEEAKALQKKFNVSVRGTWSKDKALFAIYDHDITPKLVNPTWVIDYPLGVSPLSRIHRSKSTRAERFEGYIGGVEIFDGWTEIASGPEQRARFEKEQKNMKDGDTEAMLLDEDFIEALEYGCPPLGGIGFGIDRMVMFLTDTWAIKDVLSFPTLRPKN
ncbi:MAG: lysine--tRNA ligase [Patescibacteria group bacterium]